MVPIIENSTSGLLVIGGNTLLLVDCLKIVSECFNFSHDKTSQYSRIISNIILKLYMDENFMTNIQTKLTQKRLAEAVSAMVSSLFNEMLIEMQKISLASSDTLAGAVAVLETKYGLTLDLDMSVLSGERVDALQALADGMGDSIGESINYYGDIPILFENIDLELDL